jgi:hypothetical protein
MNEEIKNENVALKERYSFFFLNHDITILDLARSYGIIDCPSRLILDQRVININVVLLYQDFLRSKDGNRLW